LLTMVRVLGNRSERKIRTLEADRKNHPNWNWSRLSGIQISSSLLFSSINARKV
jgi:hypothetical protein